MKYLAYFKIVSLAKSAAVFLLLCLNYATPLQAQIPETTKGVVAGNDGPLTCMNAFVTLTGISTTPDVTYRWSGPDGYNASTNIAVASIPGIYTLTVTNPADGSSVTATTVVTENLSVPANVDATVSGPLNCTHLSVSLGGTTSTGSVNYNWSGPNNFASASQNPMITHSGTYKLTVTNTDNGCMASDTVAVTENFQVPDVSTQGATITCTDQVVDITANSLTPGVAYLWSDNVILSDLNLPTVSVFESGNYSVTVTDPANGCTNTATVTVGLNNAEPDLTALASGILTCSNLTVTLTASSNTPGVVLTWTGLPGQNPVSVTNPGTYTVTAHNPANSCVKSYNVSVLQDVVKPDLLVMASGTHLTCRLTSVMLTAGSTTPGATLRWTGYSAGENPITVSSPGTYYATAQSTGNGCTKIDSVVVTQNNQVPDLVATGGNITCIDQVITISASSSAPVTYQWSDNVILSEPTDPNPMVFEGGDYSVTVTNTENGCTNSTTVTVVVDNVSPVCSIISPASPEALASNTITGQVTNSSPTATYTYSWSLSSPDPNWAIVSGTSTPELIYHAGSAGTSATFTLTVTSSNGCVPSVYTRVVTAAGCIPPSDVQTTTSSDKLTCAVTNVILNGSSSTPGVTYQWSGPNGFSSALQSPVINLPGTYTITVTNPGNNCSATASTEVKQNIAVPDLVATGGTITCIEQIIAISASSSAPVTYLWSDNVILSDPTDPNPMIIDGGDYSVTVTNTENGCTNSTTVTVVVDNVSPVCSIISPSSPEALASNTITGQVTNPSPTATYTYSWSLSSPDPNWAIVSGTSAPELTYHAGSAGTSATFTLTVTSSNGCYPSSCTKIVTAAECTPPTDVQATSSGTLTCAVTSVTLGGSSSTPGVTYQWTGPNGFTSAIQNPVTSLPGTYTLTVTNPVNSCSVTRNTEVHQNIAVPDLVATGGTITCTNQVITISASSTAPVTYQWSDNVILSEPTDPNPMVFEGEDYSVTVTNTENGCTNSTTVTVVFDNGSPVCSIISPASPEALSDNTVTAQETIGASYAWSISTAHGWSIVSGANTPALTFHAGNAGTSSTIHLTVTRGNGCAPTSCTKIVTAAECTPPTDVQAISSGTLTCAVTNVSLGGSSSTPGVTYQWTGPNGFTAAIQNPVTSLPGTYTLTVTNPGNNCSATASTEVKQNIAVPDLVATGGTITCIEQIIAISASSTDPVTYLWSDNVILSDPTDPNPMVFDGGDYSVTVTNTENGCSNSTTVTVVVDNVYPVCSIISPASPEALASNAIIGQVTNPSPTATYTYSWSLSSPDPNWAIVSGTSTPELTYHAGSAGTSATFTLTITSSNGCYPSSCTKIVTAAECTPPTDVQAISSGTLTCAVTSVTLGGSSSTPGVTYQWTGPNGFTSAIQNPVTSLPGTYNLTVTNPVNSCSVTRNTEVHQNIAVPDLVATGGTITCTNQVITISASSTTPVTYLWYGDDAIFLDEYSEEGGPTSISQSPMVFDSRDYSVIVTNTENGCTNSATVNVGIDNGSPVCIINGTESPTALGDNIATALVTNSPSTDTYTYSWRISSPNPNWAIVSGANTPELNYHAGDAGTSATFQLTVTSSNGCAPSICTREVPVGECISPSDVYATSSGILTCAATTVTLTGSSSTPGVTYQWSGRDGFTSALQTFSTYYPGNYTVTVTNSITGCKKTATVNVGIDNTKPNLTASISGHLNCVTNTITLQASSTSPGVLYQWSGPNGFTSALQNPVTSLPGTYTIKVTKPENGCSETLTRTVLEDMNAPSNVNTSSSGTLTCAITSVTLTGSSSTPGVTYQWRDWNNVIISTAQNTLVYTSGLYSLVVTNSSNGCTSTANTEVLLNNEMPDFFLNSSNEITCAMPNVALGVFGYDYSIPDLIYQWSGPDGFSSALARFNTNLPGTYTLLATNLKNGCTVTKTFIVPSDTIKPNVSINSSGNLLTCTITSITLTASTTTPEAFLQWSPGPYGFPSSLPNPTVNNPGTYYVTATSPFNGCISQASIDILHDNSFFIPMASCNSPVITGNPLILYGEPHGMATYSWTGPNGFTSPEQSPLVSASATAAMSGTYTLTVIGSSGCQNSTSIIVTVQNPQSNNLVPSVYPKNKRNDTENNADDKLVQETASIPDVKQNYLN